MSNKSLPIEVRDLCARLDEVQQRQASRTPSVELSPKPNSQALRSAILRSGLSEVQIQQCRDQIPFRDYWLKESDAYLHALDAIKTCIDPRLFADSCGKLPAALGGNPSEVRAGIKDEEY
ncbi:uncharacterized protein B0I36DRAFT_354949 [Microdochium trichocladiopsis]|uniref:Uncharacterized protein n=1 Tax=Microdochium trichocladiopsis TaxID=1682393 RepID=A0A9P8XSS9_9PEZI|nr:uncharacterized protein B0I36DRAFT_354949 [Microdochium trichocladiopsis]KAH7016080.1 hypothetical protein B0I36DRAFT_354949 [Microdochium trichocladiopsis]